MRMISSLRFLSVLVCFFIGWLDSSMAATTAAPPAYVRKGLVILDAGHGGYDLGAHNQFCE